MPYVISWEIYQKSFRTHFKEVNVSGDIVASHFAGPLHRFIYGIKYLVTFIGKFERLTYVAGTLT